MPVAESPPASGLRHALARERRDVERCLSAALRAEGGVPVLLRRAMAHSLLGGGKRLRPVLLLWAYDAAVSRRRPVVSRAAAMQVAAGLEMIHTYSLIQTTCRPWMTTCCGGPADLPCGVRRSHGGLAGPTGRSFGLLAEAGGPRSRRWWRAWRRVGPTGMVGGQQSNSKPKVNL
jgi:hypothetical protein